MADCLHHAKHVEETLFHQLKSFPRNDRYIHVHGENGYFCIMKFSSRKKTVNRVGRFEKLMDVVEDCFLEYCVLSRKEYTTLKFEVIKLNDVMKLYPNFSKNSWCMYNGEFFKNYDCDST